jgi:hypothetical protein
MFSCTEYSIYSEKRFFMLSSICKRGSAICRFWFRLFGGFWFSGIRRAPQLRVHRFLIFESYEINLVKKLNLVIDSLMFYFFDLD